MKKVLLQISYEGTAYAGWQRQANALSIQEVIEEAITKLTGQKVSLFSASRTDAGVHALAQYASFEDESAVPAEKFSFALNTKLPEDVRIVKSIEVPMQFNCRYDVLHKSYLYRIYPSAHASAIFRNTSYHVPSRLDFFVMQEAARQIVGEHDFSAFEAVGGQTKNKVREMFASEFFWDNGFLCYRIRGKGFLYNMVRIIAGTLVDIGMGKLQSSCIQEAFVSLNRNCLGHTAPARGLLLEHIAYPEFE